MPFLDQNKTLWGAMGGGAGEAASALGEGLRVLAVGIRKLQEKKVTW